MRPQLKSISLSAKLYLIEVELQAIDAEILKIEDWNYFSTQTIDKGLAPLFYKKLPLLSNSHLIPTPLQNKLKAAYYKTLSRSMMLYEAYHEVIQAFQKAGIHAIGLKGVYISEHLYQDIGLRLMSDIDILVKEEDGEHCLELLKGLGYTALPFQKNISEFTDKIDIGSFLESGAAHYRPMLKGEVSVEIHSKLQNTSEEYQQNLEEIWANAKNVTINGLPALALDNYNLLIHLCLHLHKHFTVLEHVQFTAFADITNILSEIERAKNKEQRLPPAPKGVQEKSKMGLEEFVWVEFIDKCKEINAEEPVFKYLLLCREYFNAPLPDYLYEAYKHTFTDKDRVLFYKHLTGYDFAADKDNSAVPVHFRNIRHIKNPLLKLRYVWEVVFPPKQFMIEKYSIKQPRLFWLWYPYRYYCGLRGLVKVVSGK